LGFYVQKFCAAASLENSSSFFKKRVGLTYSGRGEGRFQKQEGLVPMKTINKNLRKLNKKGVGASKTEK